MYCLFEKTENKQKEAGLAQFKKNNFLKENDEILENYYEISIKKSSSKQVVDTST